MPFFIVTAVKTSNLTYLCSYLEFQTLRKVHEPNNSEFLFYLVITGATPNNKDVRSMEHYFWEPVSKDHNKTAYVGSLRVNHSSSLAGRFIVGHMELPIENSCSVANVNFSMSDYANTTGTFCEHNY
jgi:hypothetical protein